jgi:hypothetical protein
MAFLMVMRVGAADASSSITTPTLLKTSIFTLVLGVVTQRSEPRAVRDKGIMTDRTQIYAHGKTVLSIG